MGVSSDLTDAKRALLEARLRRSKAPAARIARRTEGSSPPLSYAQERVWFMEQYAPGSAAYHVAVAVELIGVLDTAALSAALKDVATRHESLRMRFPSSADGRPRVAVDAEPRAAFDLAEAPDEDAALEMARLAAGEPFDLAAGPLLRALLIRIAPQTHLLAILTHHIVCDGWSVDLVVGDVLAAYRARLGGTAPAWSTPTQYGDFAAWQRESDADLQRHLAYWKAALAGVPALELPTDRARPPAQSLDGGVLRVELDADVIAPMAALAKEHGATLFMTLLAAWQVLLAKYSGQSDFALGTPIAGRTLPELESTVGMFNNMLALRSSLDGDPAFTELVVRTRTTVLDALAHQDLPFEHLVNQIGVVRDPSRSPVFQATFAMQNFERRTHPAAGPSGPDQGPAAKWMPLELPSTRFDLELRAAEISGGRLWCEFTYATALFDEATVERLAGHFTNLLRSIGADPAARLSTLDMVAAEERDRLEGWGAARAEHPVTATLHELFEQHAVATPDAIALSADSGTSLTYEQLNRSANRLAHALRARGVGPDDLVALSLDRGPDQVIAILGVLKAGAAYVPLDPAHPAERLAFILDDTAAAILIGAAPAGYTGEVLDVHQDGPEHDPGRTAAPQNLAYVIYTSGSTGKPKGVLIEHRQVVRLLRSTEEHFAFGADDVWALLHSYAFDFSVWEIWGALAYGGRLVIVGSDGVRDHEMLYGILQREGVTVLNQTPAAFRGMRAMLLSTGRTFADLAVHTIVFGGDALRVRELRQWFTQHGERPRLVNMYGITETTVHVTATTISRRDSRADVASPIGTALGDLSTYVLDPAGKLSATKVPGELYVGGAGLARGYLNRPELTAERFLETAYGRLYRTGDRVRRLPNGTLEFLGRVDHQVKVRGYRIELGEIEAAILRHPDVTAVAVQPRDDGSGDRQLVAYVVGQAASLKEHLKATLPDYMVPSAFVTLDVLPLTPNGKLDTKALPAPDMADQAAEYAPPRTGLEKTIAGVWADLLRVDRVGLDDDFFDLGGHSLLATQVMARLRRELGADAPPIGVVDLFRRPTVRELAKLAESPVDTDAPRRLLYELTRPIPDGQRTLTYVCIPYGGGSAVVYQPIADALPAGYALYSAAIHGQDVGRIEDALPFEEIVERVVTEIGEQIDGPIALWGHCGVGSALSIEIARALEAQGRPVEAVFTGAIFPFQRPKGIAGWLSKAVDMERLHGNRTYLNRVKARGVDLDDLEPAEIDKIVSNMRRDGRIADDYYGGLLDQQVTKLRAPVISVVGERDQATEYYQERFREWEFITDTVALVVVDEGNHYFIRYRAGEIAEVMTRTPNAVMSRNTADLEHDARGPEPGWWLADVHRPQETTEKRGRKAATPSMSRFSAVATGQLVSLLGSSFTSWSIPVWYYIKTGSVAQFSLFVALAMLPGLLVAPIAGAVTDRGNRKTVMLAGDCGALVVQLAMGLLLWTDNLQVGHVYGLIVALSIALTFQRVAFTSAVPQLVPKRLLGHAIGITEAITGFATLFVPIVAVGLLAAIDLDGILVIDVTSYVFTILVTAMVAFPRRMGWRRRQPLLKDIADGFSFSWGHRNFRAMLVYFLISNLFLAPALIMMTPLVLSFGTLGQAATVSIMSGLGATFAGITVALWGGPKRRRILGMQLATLGLAASAILVGLRPAVPTIAIGAFGMAAGLALGNGIYRTLVQMKIPQRYHARAAALNQMISWSTLPFGFAILAPWSVQVLEPLLAYDGALAATVGRFIGVGEGRGIGLLYIIIGLAVMALVAVTMRMRVIARFDRDVPDALPDDLVGAQELAARQARS